MVDGQENNDKKEEVAAPTPPAAPQQQPQESPAKPSPVEPQLPATSSVEGKSTVNSDLYNKLPSSKKKIQNRKD